MTLAAGRGALGLVAGLGLIGLLWLSAIHPAGAAFAVSTPVPLVGAVASHHTAISVTRLADGAERPAAPAPGVQARAGTGGLQSSLEVCELVIDTSAADPLASGCAAPAAQAN